MSLAYACPRCRSLVLDGRCPMCGSPLCESTAGVSSAAMLLGLALGGCILGGKESAEAAYGIKVVDLDEDGWDSESDCDDDDPTVHPEAKEKAGDGVDSDCDGEDDT